MPCRLIFVATYSVNSVENPIYKPDDFRYSLERCDPIIKGSYEEVEKVMGYQILWLLTHRTLNALPLIFHNELGELPTVSYAQKAVLLSQSMGNVRVVFCGANFAGQHHSKGAKVKVSIFKNVPDFRVKPAHGSIIRNVNGEDLAADSVVLGG